MDTSARHEDPVEIDRVKKRLANPRSNPIPEALGSNKQTQPQDQVRPDVIHGGAYETFVEGAGI